MQLIVNYPNWWEQEPIINRKLREIEELPEAEVCRILPGKPDDEELE